MAKLVADFTDVESSGSVRIPEGDYRARVAGVKQAESKEGNQMLVWTFEITEGKYKGKEFKDYTVLQANALWKLKQLLEILGVTVPAKKIDLIPLLKKVKGAELGITVTDEEYKNKISSKVSDYLELETLEDLDADDDEDDDDEEDEKPKKKAKSKKKKHADEDEDEIEDLDLNDI